MNNKLYFYGLLVIFGGCAVLVGGKFFYLLFFINLISIMYSKFTCRKIEKNLFCMYRVYGENVMRGDTIGIRYGVYNESMWPVAYIELDDGIPWRVLSNGEQRDKVFSIPPYEGVYIEKTIKCMRRGIYQLGKLNIVIGDILGIVKKEFVVKDEVSLIVYPRIYKLENFSAIGRDFFGSVSTNLIHYEDYSSIKEVRKYNYGDSFKRVDWKTTAKKGELYVKQYDVSVNVQLRIYMDFDLNKYIEDKEGFLEERVVESAVSIMNYCLYKGIYTEMVTFTDRKIQIVGRNMENINEVLDILARIKPKKNINLEGIISTDFKTMSLETTIIIVTPYINKDFLPELLLLKNRGVNVKVILVNDFSNNKEANNCFIAADKLRINIIKLDMNEDISYALR